MKRDSLGQLIMTGVPGKELDAKTARLFRRVQPGAFILFGRNIESAPQLRKLIDDLRDLSEVEPIITIDQEGGRVSRLRLIGNEPPNAQQLRDKDDVEDRKSTRLNSSHTVISYAVFCLKKKITKN